MAETASPPEDLMTSLGQQRVISDDPSGPMAVEFLAAQRMCHSGGVVQGGFVCAWLDAAMARAAMAATGGEMTPMSLELKVSFFAPVHPGLVVAEGWVERLGRSTAFLEGRLLDGEGRVLAKGSSTARLTPRAALEARVAARAGGE
jgi:uncharacterized protein (TIGR00369 family)